MRNRPGRKVTKSFWPLWEGLEPAVRRIAAKALALHPAARSAMTVDDLVSVGKIAFCRVARAWKPERGPLENYLLKTLRLDFRKLLRAEAARRKQEIPFSLLEADEKGEGAPRPLRVQGTTDDESEWLGIEDALGKPPATEAEPLGVLALLRELNGPPLPLRARAACFEAAFGAGFSKSALHRARQRAMRTVRNQWMGDIYA